VKRARPPLRRVILGNAVAVSLLAVRTVLLFSAIAVRLVSRPASHSRAT
jgi:hypothetical protein